MITYEVCWQVEEEGGCQEEDRNGDVENVE